MKTKIIEIPLNIPTTETKKNKTTQGFYEAIIFTIFKQFLFFI